MKSPSFAALCLALFLGLAMAFIRPAQPVQVANAVPSFLVTIKNGDGLDNPAIEADNNIHASRKCKYQCWIPCANDDFADTFYFPFCKGGFCMGVSFVDPSDTALNWSLRDQYCLGLVSSHAHYLSSFLPVSRTDELPSQWPLGCGFCCPQRFGPPALPEMLLRECSSCYLGCTIPLLK
jgi:hypothetical protein